MLGNLLQAAAGNLVKIPLEDIKREFQEYLLPNEEIIHGYKLIRDLVIFTNLRIILVDKQGATGKKTAIKTVFLMNIIDVTAETSGAGFDDSEITIAYLNNVYLKSRNESYSALKLEFPKNANIAPLYKELLNVAFKNRRRINGM